MYQNVHITRTYAIYTLKNNFTMEHTTQYAGVRISQKFKQNMNNDWKKTWCIKSALLKRKLMYDNMGNGLQVIYLICFSITGFLKYFFSLRHLSVLRLHSFFHPRHKGQWPPTSKDFLCQILFITFIFLS